MVRFILRKAKGLFSSRESFGPPQQLVRVIAAAVSWRSVKATTINIPYVVSLLIQQPLCCQGCFEVKHPVTGNGNESKSTSNWENTKEISCVRCEEV